MSIASKLIKLETDISNAYDSIETKEGTIPANKNTENLKNAILSIPTGIDTSDATATANDILSPKTAYANGVKLTGALKTQNKTVNPKTSQQVITADNGNVNIFYNGEFKSEVGDIHYQFVSGNVRNFSFSTNPNIVLGCVNTGSGAGPTYNIYFDNPLDVTDMETLSIDFQFDNLWGTHFGIWLSDNNTDYSETDRVYYKGDGAGQSRTTFEIDTSNMTGYKYLRFRCGTGTTNWNTATKYFRIYQISALYTGSKLLNQVTVNAVTSSIDSNIVASNIKSGVSILGVSGNVVELNGETKTITPTTSQQTITPTSPKNAITEVTVNAVTSSIDNNIVAGNIKKDISILGVTGTYEGSGGGGDTILDVGSNNVSVSGTTLVFEEAKPYIELEYIESSGTQWIDTGYKPSNNTNIQYHGVYEGKGSSQYIATLFGVSQSSNPLKLLTVSGYDNDISGGPLPSVYYSNINYNSNINYDLTNKDLSIKLENGIFTFNIDNNVVVKDFSSAPDFSLPYNLTIFCYNSNNNKNFTSKGKLYSFKIYEGNTIVRDYIPVKRKSDLEVCLYDKVSNTFFTNNGTGSFIAGNEV